MICLLREKITSEVDKVSYKTKFSKTRRSIPIMARKDI